MLREQHRALQRPSGWVVVDGLEAGVEQLEHAVGLRAATKRGSRCVAGAWSAAGPTRSPPSRAASGCRDQRASRWLSAVVPVRDSPTMKIGSSTAVAPAPGGCGASRDAEPVGEVAADLAVETPAARAVETGLRGPRCPHGLEPVAERRVAEVVEPDLARRRARGRGSPSTSTVRSPSASRGAAPARRDPPWSAPGRTRRPRRRARCRRPAAARRRRSRYASAAHSPTPSPKIPR